jgi:hypothetical protein
MLTFDYLSVRVQEVGYIERQAAPTEVTIPLPQSWTARRLDAEDRMRNQLRLDART